MNPETLRTVFRRSTKNHWNLSELDVALTMHADAWDADRKLLQEAISPIRAMYFKTRSEELARWLRRAREASL